MADPRPTKKYACSQAELYAINEIGLASYGENLVDFTAFSAKYDAQFGTDTLAAVQSTKDMPDFQARNEIAETAHIGMITAVQKCNRNWRKLRRHIANAFPKDEVKPKAEAAGEEHYRKALARNWAEAELMLSSATTFLVANAALLTAGGMPAAFPTSFGTDATTFLDLYSTFTDAEQDEVEGTDAKLLANNAIYETLMGMFEDGQVIFEENAAKRNRFIFQRVYELVKKPTGSTTIPKDAIVIKGAIIDIQTGLPVINALVETIPQGSTEPFTAETDENGQYELLVTDLAQTTVNGSLIVNAMAENYDPASEPLSYQTGNEYELNFQLSPAAPPPPIP